MPAMLIGLIAGVVCYFMVSVVKNKFGYDDALDAFGVHGIGGTVGAILTGVFATKEINDLRMGKPMGLIDGNPGQVINNLIGAADRLGARDCGHIDYPQGVRCGDRRARRVNRTKSKGST